MITRASKIRITQNKELSVTVVATANANTEIIKILPLIQQQQHERTRIKLFSVCVKIFEEGTPGSLQQLRKVGKSGGFQRLGEMQISYSLYGN